MTDTIPAPTTATTWHDKAAKLTIDGRPVINGERVEARSGQIQAKTNPANGETISQLHLGGQADVDAAVSAARAAYESGE